MERLSFDGAIYPDFADLDLDPTVPDVQHRKQEKQLSVSLRKHFSLCRRKVFAVFVSSKKSGDVWVCCGQSFSERSSLHKHVARNHEAELEQGALRDFQRNHHNSRTGESGRSFEEPQGESRAEEPRLETPDLMEPDISHLSEEQLTRGPGRVLLYYCYTDVADPLSVCAWQKSLCKKLHLTGKVRVASEGINGTVGGSCVSTDLYIQAMSSSPVFSLSREHFKTSAGGAECFSELKVGVYREIVPMGLDPGALSYREAGSHLEPEEFHREVEAMLSEGDHNTVLLDCRNFYESKIGQFTHCLAPNIRKFSYFPDYVDQNLELFRDKRVLMYCTGGIRCERASAYLRTKEVCKEVLQLRGGIHRYLELFPEGHYRGKLFVFDQRFAISSNDDIISECRYCSAPWDQYQLCSSSSCRQLVLSCPQCRGGDRTACCPTCQSKERPLDCTTESGPKEQCECTASRPRIPQDAQM